MSMHVEAKRAAVRVRGDLPRDGTLRLIDADEALRALPRLYDRVRRRSPGFISRSRDWWEVRRLSDRPENRRGAGPLVIALYQRGGTPAGYALYRIAQEGATFAEWKKTVRVVEVQGVDEGARRDIWRFLLEVDWTDVVRAEQLPMDDPLLLLVDRVNELGLRMYDGLWVRAIDVGAALEARGADGDGRATVEVTDDPQFPDNVGTWTVEPDRVRRSSRRPDVRTDVQGLGSVMLGGFTFAQLARAGRAKEGTRGGLARADALFRVERAPSCPEIF
jgi:predicted acetyltransferase